MGIALSLAGTENIMLNYISVRFVHSFVFFFSLTFFFGGGGGGEEGGRLRLIRALP